MITEDASDHLEITAAFVELRDAPDAGRAANFTIANKSEYSLVRFRGWIVGMDSNGEDAYEFPWSRSAMPEVARANSTVPLEDVGFDVPASVVGASVVFREFDFAR